MIRNKTPEIDRPFDNRYLFALIFPLLVELLLNVAIGMADTMMVSSCGEEAISGVSLVDQLANLFVFIFNAFATGGAVVTSQYLGAGDKERANRSAKQLMYMTFAVSFVASVILFFFRRGIMSLVFGSIEPLVMLSAVRYLVPLSFSFIFLAMTNSLNALARSMGKAKFSMVVSLIMNLMNIAGNAVFIFVFHLGSFGAGLASLISRMAAFFIMLSFMKRKNNEIRLEHLLHMEWLPSMQKRIMRIALPSGIENGLFHLGKILVASTVASFGTVSIASNAVMNAVGGLCNVPGSAVGMAAITVIGHCCGADRYDDAKYYMKKLLLIAYTCMICTIIAIACVSEDLVAMYHLSEEGTLMTHGLMWTFFIQHALFWPLAFTLPNFLRASGDAKFTMGVSIFSMWTFRIVFSWVLGVEMGMGLSGIWWAMYLDWYCRGAFFIVRLLRGKWMTKKVI